MFLEIYFYFFWLRHLEKNISKFTTTNMKQDLTLGESSILKIAWKTFKLFKVITINPGLYNNIIQ